VENLTLAQRRQEPAVRRFVYGARLWSARRRGSNEGTGDRWPLGPDLGLLDLWMQGRWRRL